MPPNQYFSLPLLTRGQPQTLRAGHSPSKRRKRQRTHYTEDEDLRNANEHAIPDGSRDGPALNTLDARPIPSSAVVLDPESAEQYRVAGCSGDEPLPLHFPHRSLDADTPGEGNSGRNVEAQLHRGLSQLSPSLYVPYALRPTGSSISRSPHVTGLRLHHLSVLTTVMYRCLLDGDYGRAGRAWGMLLRTEVRGKAFDLRGDGRWGIGVEVLLREGLRSEMNHILDESSDSEVDDVDRPPDEHRAAAGQWFTREGFAKAKEYYERLVLQYPYDKRWPSKVNSLHFYLAMFGLWIYVTQQERKEGLAGNARGHAEDVSLDQEHSDSEAAEEMRRRELLEAESIASRMDELMLSPPYSDSSELWHLRGMVALWMADLCLPAVSAFPEGGEDDMNAPAANVHGTDFSRKHDDELNRAKSAFQKVRSTRGVVWDGVSRLLQDEEDMEDV